MRMTENRLRIIIREAIRNRWKDPYPRRRNQEKKRDWVIVCDWTKSSDPKDHRHGTAVYAEHYGTKASAEFKAKQYSKERGIRMWVEEGYEQG